MDALIIQLLSTYAEGAVICVLSFLLYLSTKRLAKLETKVETTDKSLHTLTDKFFTKEETREHIAQESKLTEKSMVAMTDAISRLENSNDRLDALLSDIRTHLLHNYTKK